MADTRTLVVLISGERAGEVTMDASGRLSFTYDEEWQSQRLATPLSLSMPPYQRTHEGEVVRAFLWGLLPDNERVLQRWASMYQVSAQSPFAILQHVGEDCAGAAQFVRPDRVASVLAGEGAVRWLDEAEVEERLRTLRADPTAWHSHNTGQFSLAGAQAKTALYFDQARRQWGDPSGAIPTTHILKPAVTGLDDHDLNEHLCLTAARAMGLTAAHTTVSSYGAERVIVVERYDRRYVRGKVLRIHQEDMCQAAGLPPTAKYQNDGGPTPESIVDLIRRNVFPLADARAQVARFVDALALNWVIAGTDAHAKNYSVLLSGEQVRLAPLYDMASALPYDGMYLPKLTMAMKIDKYYEMRAIHGRHWRRFAAANSLDPDETVDRVRILAQRAPDAFATAAAAPDVQALESALPAKLCDRIAARAEHCVAALDA